jgi:hypothetical protein
MAQEFVINSADIESKINQLLPSQGNRGAGVDFSASTMVIPIVDLTETAEGSSVRPDLQTALCFANSPFDIVNGTSTLVTTTGFFRVIGTVTGRGGNATDRNSRFFLDDGSSEVNIWSFNFDGISAESYMAVSFDFIVFLRAGDSLKGQSPASDVQFGGSTRQIADITGNLTNPLGF